MFEDRDWLMTQQRLTTGETTQQRMWPLTAPTRAGRICQAEKRQTKDAPSAWTNC